MPFGLSESVLQGGSLLEAVCLKLTSSDLPGPIQDLPACPEVASITADCWSQDPMLQPTATAIAEKLLSCSVKFIVRIQQNTDAGFPPDTSNPQLSSLASIKDATSSRRLGDGDFKTLPDRDANFNPVDSFFLGGVLLWNLMDVSSAGGGGTAQPKHRGLLCDDEEERILEAMSHLEHAVRGGYLDAYHELYNAHATLARKHIAKANNPPRRNVD
ncbi:uncharacterized protein Z518_09098 [Rhinocladiella mackenziei CBS 650.93]|uniref:Uncharacterized protein n=1 Tax=Rhinocladiella mackenziei CBS 650.93 TaxID=1442369 RepID=A0A0D2GSL9_9EURO|nr:uncharacterized protein Z518_09098 [Rhinocladiella mackenziei CBS 650.93]KIX01373.1 hypothetical protein Z518_09098 [Rhinocladiella mackenziei CBS 650.93]